MKSLPDPLYEPKASGTVWLHFCMTEGALHYFSQNNERSQNEKNIMKTADVNIAVSSYRSL